MNMINVLHKSRKCDSSATFVFDQYKIQTINQFSKLAMN